jgi:hypothetical protein
VSEQGCAQDAGLRKFFERLVVEAQPLATATATASVQPLCDDSQVHSDTELSADAAARPQGSDGRAEGEHARTGAGADCGNSTAHSTSQSVGSAGCCAAGTDAAAEHAAVEAFLAQPPAGRLLLEWIPR